MSTIVQSKPAAKISVIASLTVVILSVALGSGFVWWYLRGESSTRTIRLSPDDLATLQNASHQMAYKSSGGVPNGVRPRVNARLINRAAGDPDGVFPAGNWQVIKAGQVQVRVQPGAAATDPPTIIFRQRTWGLLQDSPSFTIARRIVREDTLAKQLAVDPTQLGALAKITITPPVHGDYLTALPVDPADLKTVANAWADYQKAGATKAAQPALLNAVREIGNSAMSKAKAEYANSAKGIDSIIEPRQIEAYHSGKTLTPLK